MKIEIDGTKIAIEFSDEDIATYWTPEERETGDIHVDRLQSVIDKIDPNSGVLFFMSASTGEVNHFVLDEECRRLNAAKAKVQERLKATGLPIAGALRSNVAGWLDCRVKDVVNFEKAGLLTRLKGAPVRYAIAEVLALRGCFVEIDAAFLEAIAKGEKVDLGQATIHSLSELD